MRNALFAGTVLALALLAGPAAEAAGTLKVCIAEDTPPLSDHKGGKASGFDVAVAEALAKRLDRTLAIQWFENELDEGSSFTLEANALLSDGLCDLVSSYPLIEGTLGKPPVVSARLPGHEGGKPADRRRLVTLGTLVPSKPYYYSALTVVLGGPATAKPIHSLDDLEGVKIGEPEGSLADAVMMTFHNRRFVSQITHVVPGPQGHLFERLEHGDYDATLVSLRGLDAYRAAHPDTKLKGSGFYYKFGFNMGFSALSTAAPLLEAVNAALAEMQAKGEFQTMGQAAGMTYLPPRQPDVSPNISMFDLFRD
ncbi:MAG TPA: transporter substrate-binding domain-containing protein [Candidatus Sulfotelmatobacter sp.]|nr:transporter substrate-binding domain-containing protein [Candidatus Sulfotelmatobacter sp.]